MNIMLVGERAYREIGTHVLCQAADLQLSAVGFEHQRRAIGLWLEQPLPRE